MIAPGPAWRFGAVLAGLAVLAVVCMGRLWTLVYVEGEFLAHQGDLRTIRAERTSAHRGMILDRHGRPLAISTPVDSLWVDPRLVDPAEPGWARVAETLGVEPDALAHRLRSQADRAFLYLRRQAPPEVVDAVLAEELTGVFVQPEFKRFYPAGEVAAHLVGITNIDDSGQEGIELAYDEWLGGSPGERIVVKDRRGRTFQTLRDIETATNGGDLHLTLDLRLQYLAYRELKAAVQANGARAGSIVMLDAATGDLLAVANQPSYNPNSRRISDPAQLRNRAFTDVFEPGSTVKPFTVAAALSAGTVDGEAEIDTSPGFIEVDGKVIKDPSDRGVLSVAEVVAHSSQVGITRIALDLDERELRGTLRRFGFGASTGSGYPGESAGTLPRSATGRRIEHITRAYGYGLAVTAIQLAQGYLAFANDGRQPVINIVRDARIEETRDVLDPEVAVTVRNMLESVIDVGTGQGADVPGYRVAGKTGTAEKLGKSGYEDDRHVAFFAGIVPASAPRLVTVIVIDEPTGEAQGGGSVAAPVFGRVMAQAARILEIPPDGLARLPGTAVARAGGRG